MKNINDRWGIGVELSHAFKTKKKLRDIKIFNYTLENNTSISKTDLRVLLTYRH
jgi:hypothetical protein